MTPETDDEKRRRQLRTRRCSGCGTRTQHSSFVRRDDGRHRRPHCPRCVADRCREHIADHPFRARCPVCGEYSGWSTDPDSARTWARGHSALTPGCGDVGPGDVEVVRPDPDEFVDDLERSGD